HLAYAVDHAWLVDAFTRLAEATGQARWIAAARAAADALLMLFWDADAGEYVLHLLGDLLHRAPIAFTNALAAVDLLVSGVSEVAIVGDRPDMVAAVQTRFEPNAVLAWGEPYPSPLWEGRQPGLAYVCRNYACQAPVDDPAALLEQLG